MKKMMILMASVMLSLTACADHHAQPCSFNELPQTAQTFVDTYFGQATIAFILKDREGLHYEYEVRLNDGSKIEFDQAGNLEKVDCKYKAIPDGIVPQPIATYVTSKHPQQFIVEYSIDRREQKVELNNEIEIEFDRAGNFLRYDW